jgi:hypothetical protein
LVALPRIHRKLECDGLRIVSTMNADILFCLALFEPLVLLSELMA